jgi:hypothetical protein
MADGGPAVASGVGVREPLGAVVGSRGATVFARGGVGTPGISRPPPLIAIRLKQSSSREDRSVLPFMRTCFVYYSINQDTAIQAYKALQIGDPTP